jgi:hypothetical protein
MLGERLRITAMAMDCHGHGGGCLGPLQPAVEGQQGGSQDEQDCDTGQQRPGDSDSD